MASALAAALIAITHVAVIDVRTGNIAENRTVVIQADRIQSVSAQPPPAGARIFEGRGKFLIPGLWDMHVHLGGIEADWFPLYIANGIVGLREMASSKERLRLVKLHKGPPRIYSTTESLDAPAIKTPQQARAAIADLQSRGADFAKVYNGLSRDAYFALADECQRRNFPFVGHLPDAISPIEAALAGQRSIEHLDNLLRSRIPAQAIFEAFKKHGVWQCPTLLVHRPVSPQTDPHLKYVRPDYLPEWKQHATRFHDTTFDGIIFERLCALTAAMQKAGVKFLAGTDTPYPYSIPGFALHDELQLLVERAHFSPLESLQTATIHPNMFFNLKGGVIEKDRPADLLLLDANPLTNIKNTQQINAIFTQGQAVDKTTRQKLLVTVEAAIKR